MLQEVARKYESNKKTIQKQSSIYKQKIQEQIQNYTILALKVQNHKVSQIHKNQQQIEVKLRKQNELLLVMRQSVGQWSNLYDSLNKALKQAGDLVNYAQYISDQVYKVQKALGYQKKQNWSNSTKYHDEQ